MQLMGINIWAVVSSAVATTMLRLLWHSPLLFARTRMRLSGGVHDEHFRPNETPKRSGKFYVLFFLASLLTAFVLGQVIRISTVSTALLGMKVGAGMWLGFVSTLQLTNNLLSRKPLRLYLIDTGYQLFSFLMMGAIIAAWPRPPQRMGTEMGFGIFQERCMSCHGNPDASHQAPDPSALRRLTPDAIYAALTTGGMKVQGQGLTDQERRRVAEWLGGRPLGSLAAGDARSMKNHCSNNAPLSDPSLGPTWNGWGAGVENARFQAASAAGIAADEVPRLTLAWAFGYPNGITAAGQPTIASGRVFVGTDIGYVYSLDARTGCVYWSSKTEAGVRNAISIGPLTKAGHLRYAIYFGDAKANVYALDASTGALLWTKRVEDHFTARITGAPTLYQERLYVPVSSSEEWSASSPDYPCCTFRGSVVALDATTGQQIWKTYVVPEVPESTRKMLRGYNSMPLRALRFGILRRSTQNGVRSTSGLGTRKLSQRRALPIPLCRWTWIREQYFGYFRLPRTIHSCEAANRVPSDLKVVPRRWGLTGILALLPFCVHCRTVAEFWWQHRRAERSLV
jgi:hypothetical protein